MELRNPRSTCTAGVEMEMEMEMDWDGEEDFSLRAGGTE